MSDELNLSDGEIPFDDLSDDDLIFGCTYFDNMEELGDFIERLKFLGASNFVLEVSYERWDGGLIFQLPKVISLDIMKTIADSHPDEFQIREDVIERAVRLWWD